MVKTFEVMVPIATPIGTYQAGVVGTVVHHREARSPDGIMRTLVRINDKYVEVPTASIRVDPDPTAPDPDAPPCEACGGGLAHFPECPEARR